MSRPISSLIVLVLVRLHLVPFRVVALHRRGRTVAGGMWAAWARGLVRSWQRGCGILRACQAKGFQSAPQRCNRRFRGRSFSRLRGLKRDCSRARRCNSRFQGPQFSRLRSLKRVCSRAQPSATSRRRADALVILSSSRMEISSKYARRCVLRCFGAVFQKGHFDKSGFRSALSRAAGRKGAL